MTRKIVDFDQFAGESAYERFAKMMAYAAQNPGSVLRVRPGVYELGTPLSRDTMRHTIAGDYGDNPESTMFSPDFAFSEGVCFAGQKGATLIMEGVTLLVDGFMEPLAIRDCEDVKIIGLTIDHKRKPFSAGVVEAYDENGTYLDVRVSDEYPLSPASAMPRYCLYDPDTKMYDLHVRFVGHEYLSPQRYRFYLKTPYQSSPVGKPFYIWHTLHYRPGILIENAKNVHLTNVTIHSQPGMGIVCHRSENVYMTGLNVVPSKGLHMSVNTDATHFTSCKGEIVFDGCAFSGQGDDCTNVHTFYHDAKRLDDTTFIGSVGVHTHSLTLDYPDVGDKLEWSDKASLTKLSEYAVLSCEKSADGRSYTARVDKPLPKDLDAGYFSDVTRLPHLTFKNCRTANHWARDVLIKTRGALVENNVFTTCALQSVHIAAEGWWHEGVACADITVRNNLFLHCGAPTGCAVGGVLAEMSVDERKGCPQSHILIENNVFDLPDCDHAVSVSNASDVIIRGNTYHCKKEPVVIKDCEDVRAEDA